MPYASLANSADEPGLPSLVCLHGFLGRAADWADLAARWPAPVLALDLPGHGSATRRAHRAYTMTGAARHVLAAMDSAHIHSWEREPALLGYSMGGRLALHLAVHHPDRFSTVVLESASPGLRSDEERTDRRRLDRQRADEIVRDFPDFLDRWYRMPLFASLPGDVHKRLIADRLEHHADEIARALVGMGTGAQASLWTRIRQLNVSVCAVAGSLDTKFVGLAQEMEAASAGRLVTRVVDSAGHMIHAEQPEAFAAILAQILSP